jgi:hypothetical protein
MASLAEPQDLGSFMKEPIATTDPSAMLILDIASGMVRDYLHVDPETGLEPVTGDVALMDPVNGLFVFLNELPVTAVTLVETFDGTAWTTADPTTYTVSKRLGIISALPWTGVTWPTNPETWRVTHSHGFTRLPSSILGVVLGVGARQWNTDNGIDSERIGGYQVKYAMEANGFTGIELKTLNRYLYPRIA